VSHAFLSDANFWQELLDLDCDLAAEVREAGCPHCGSVLHSAPYPRKPRGIPRSVLGEAYGWRLSFCCAREGCRRRRTPRSVRFLSRRVYLGALVVLVTALTEGLTERRREILRERFGLSGRTLRRWQQWWRERLPTTARWRAMASRFVPPVTANALPASLLERFGDPGARDTLVAMLRFLVPFSIDSERDL